MDVIDYIKSSRKGSISNFVSYRVGSSTLLAGKKYFRSYYKFSKKAINYIKNMGTINYPFKEDVKEPSLFYCWFLIINYIKLHKTQNSKVKLILMWRENFQLTSGILTSRKIPVSTRRRFKVATTLLTSKQRCVDVKTTSFASMWIRCFQFEIKTKRSKRTVHFGWKRVAYSSNQPLNPSDSNPLRKRKKFETYFYLNTRQLPISGLKSRPAWRRIQLSHYYSNV